MKTKFILASAAMLAAGAVTASPSQNPKATSKAANYISRANYRNAPNPIFSPRISQKKRRINTRRRQSFSR